jgi:hypothetical protein
VCMCVYACMYIYIYMYMYTQTHTHEGAREKDKEGGETEASVCQALARLPSVVSVYVCVYTYGRYHP